MTEIADLLDSKTNITDTTRKNYLRIYNKIADHLAEDIRSTSEKNLIKTVMSLSNENPSVALTYLNVPILIKKFYNLPVELLVKKQLELNGLRATHTKQYIETKKEELPSYDTLNNHLKSLLKTGDHQKYIINYILINYGVRNKDLDLFITVKNNPDIASDKNYIFVKKTECEIVINDFKTIQNYGPKKFIVKSKHFRDAVLALGIGSYLLYNGIDKTEPIAESSLGTYIKRRLYNNLGEGDYFKILIKHSQTKTNPLEEIEKLSLSRGTSIEMILNHYNLQVKPYKV
jgi:hypothetical protein